MASSNYSPSKLFYPSWDSHWSTTSLPKTLPRVFISPEKYIQHSNALLKLGTYVDTIFKPKRVIVLVFPEVDMFGYKAQIDASFKDVPHIQFNYEIFPGESSYENAKNLIQKFKEQQIDCLIGFGGGKLLDCSKLITAHLSIPFISCPSLASNDSPCSALSIMYSDEGSYVGGEYYPHSPSMVVVDTEVIARSPIRTFVSGMGDALSTWYEARTCMSNPKALNMLYSRPTATATSIAELCAKLLYEHGERALQFMRNYRESKFKDETNRDSFESVVEANILLSGLGFESGGLAASHAVAQALTVIHSVEKNFMHGEMVAIGLLTMLCMEDKQSEAKEVATFCAKIGLPINFNQLTLGEDLPSTTDNLLKSALSQWFAHNEPFEVHGDLILSSLQKMHNLGLAVEKHVGRAAFDKLHPPRPSSPSTSTSRSNL